MKLKFKDQNRKFNFSGTKYLPFFYLSLDKTEFSEEEHVMLAFTLVMGSFQRYQASYARSSLKDSVLLVVVY